VEQMEAATRSEASATSSRSTGTRAGLTQQAASARDIISRCQSINELLRIRLDTSSISSSCPEDQTVRNSQDLQWCDLWYSKTSNNGATQGIHQSLAGPTTLPVGGSSRATTQQQQPGVGRDQATRPRLSSSSSPDNNRKSSSTSTAKGPAKDTPAAQKQRLESSRQHDSPRRVVSLPVLPYNTTAAPRSSLGTCWRGRPGTPQNCPELGL
jgi:hypothetical protein